jgi:hypothetical protein
MKNETHKVSRAWRSVLRAYETDNPLARWLALDHLQSVLSQQMPQQESEIL